MIKFLSLCVTWINAPATFYLGKIYDSYKRADETTGRY